MNQIIGRPNAEFSGDTRKLVFWYEDKEEFVEDIQDVKLEKRILICMQKGVSYSAEEVVQMLGLKG